VRRRHRWEDNIRMDLKEIRFMWRPFGFHKRRVISWQAQRLSASQEGLCYMEWVAHCSVASFVLHLSWSKEAATLCSLPRLLLQLTSRTNHRCTIFQFIRIKLFKYHPPPEHKDSLPLPQKLATGAYAESVQSSSHGGNLFPWNKL
jgi:hypothetical protein